jgi:hypothetical protein
MESHSDDRRAPSPVGEGTTSRDGEDRVAIVRSAAETLHLQRTDTIILVIVCLAQFMVVLDVSIVNVALPTFGVRV